MSEKTLIFIELNEFCKQILEKKSLGSKNVNNGNLIYFYNAFFFIDVIGNNEKDKFEFDTTLFTNIVDSVSNYCNIIFESLKDKSLVSVVVSTPQGLEILNDWNQQNLEKVNNFPLDNLDLNQKNHQGI